MNRSRMMDSIILLVLLIGVSTFPTSLLVKDYFWYYVIESLLFLLVFLYILIYERRHPEIVTYPGRFNITNLLLLLPSFIIVGSNLIYALCLNERPYYESHWYYIPEMIFIFINVLVEEYIYRKHLLGNLQHPKKIVRIVISAAIFALCHLTFFFSTFNPVELIRVAYAFGLGMVLGLLYCYTNSLVPCIVLHLLFNLINNFVFEHFFYVSNTMWYYLINVFVTIAVAIYLLVIYFVKLEKKPSISRLN